MRFRLCGRPLSREPLPRASRRRRRRTPQWKRSTCLRALASVWLKRVVLSRKRRAARARRRRRARLPAMPADRGSAAEMILSLMKCSPTKGSERFREKSRPGGPKTFFPRLAPIRFFSHGVPQRRRPDQRGPDVSFENQNFFGTCNPGGTLLELDRPGVRGTHFRHANSTRRGIRCARASLSRASVPAPSRTARRRRVIRLLGFLEAAPRV